MAENDNGTPQEQTIDYKAEWEKIQAENEKLRQSITKTNSENADYKRKLQERMSEDEKQQQAQKELAEHYKAIERENNQIKLSKQLGFIEDEAKLNEISNLFVDGDTVGGLTAVNAYVKDMQENLTKKIKAELLRTNPEPHPQSTGNGKQEVTKEQFSKMDYSARLKLKSDNPELYDKLTK